MTNAGGYRDKFISLLFLCLIFSSITAVFPAMYEEFQLAKAVCFVFFLLCCVALAASGPARPRINTASVLFALFFCWTAFRTISSRYHPACHYVLAMLAPAAFILPHYIKLETNKLLVLLNITVFAACGTGLFQFVSHVYRPYSLFGNPIFFAEFLMLMFPLLVFSMSRAGRLAPLVFINMLASAVCIMLCSSRGVFAAFLISAAMLTAYIIRNRLAVMGKIRDRNVYIIILAVFLAVIALSPVFRDAVKSAAARTIKTASLSHPEVKNRLLMLGVALDMAKENPATGLGAGAYRYLYQKYQARVLNASRDLDFLATSYAHNDYAQAAVEFGITGLALYIGFVFSLLLFYERNHSSLKGGAHFFAFAAVCSICGFLAESFFNFPLFIYPSAFIFWLFCGILNSLCLSAPGVRYPAMDRAWSFSAAAVTAAVVIAVLAKDPAGPLSDLYLKAGLQSGSGRQADAENYFRQAIKYDPQGYFPHFYLADFLAASHKSAPALQEYRAILGIYPYSADMLYNAGAVSFYTGDNAAAEKYIKQSLELYPDFPIARLVLGKIYSSTGRESAAALEFAAARAKDPSVFSMDLSKHVVSFGEVTSNVINK